MTREWIDTDMGRQDTDGHGNGIGNDPRQENDGWESDPNCTAHSQSNPIQSTLTDTLITMIAFLRG